MKYPDINRLTILVEKAGTEIMKVYSHGFSVAFKDDNSPLTIADSLSHSILVDGLPRIAELPIISEESYTTPVAHLDEYWLIDPLDGTKDFIAKNNEFTINIALVRGMVPIFGLVYVPASKSMYFASLAQGSFLNGKRIYNHSRRKHLRGTVSRFHATEAELTFFKKYNIDDVQEFGAALKFCRLAEGGIDVYPRFNGSKEWDTAAGQIIASEAGCKVIDCDTGKELLYNKATIKNNHFIASRRDLSFL